MNNRKIRVIRPSQMFDTFVDDFFTKPMWSNQGEEMEVNLKDLSDKLEITAKIPGFTSDEIDIHVEDNVLVIEASRKNENVEGEEDGDYYMREYSTANIKRSIVLPSKVNGEEGDAEIKNGILKVTFPKVPEIMPKKISIKSN